MERRWLMKRRCALTPRQLGGGLALAGGVDAMAALLAAGAGYAPIAVFCLLTVVGLAAAYVLHARHVLDCESIVLGDGELCVEQHRADGIVRVCLPVCRTRIDQCPAPHHLVRLSAGALSVQVGAHLPCHERPILARELRGALRSIAAAGVRD